MSNTEEHTKETVESLREGMEFFREALLSYPEREAKMLFSFVGMDNLICPADFWKE